MIVLCKDSDPQWKQLRWQGLTASRVPFLLGMVSWEKRSQSQQLAEYAARVEVDQSPAMWMGTCMESPGIRRAAERMGWHSWERSGELITREDCPRIMATLDAWVTPSHGTRRRVAEHKFKRFAKKGEDVSDAHIAQMQLQLHLAGEPWGYLITTVCGEWPAVRTVEYDSLTALALVHETNKLIAQIDQIRASSGG